VDTPRPHSPRKDKPANSSKDDKSESKEKVKNSNPLLWSGKSILSTNPQDRQRRLSMQREGSFGINGAGWQVDEFGTQTRSPSDPNISDGRKMSIGSSNMAPMGQHDSRRDSRSLPRSTLVRAPTSTETMPLKLEISNLAKALEDMTKLNEENVKKKHRLYRNIST